MTIQEMFEREDIYSILEKTMEEYYHVVFHKNVSVEIQKQHFLKKLVIYPRLGIVVPLIPSWKVIRRTYVSFDVQGNLLKKLFAWTYITLCFLTFGLFADASMELSDYSVINKDIIIIPSNRKIRIYDYRNQCVDSILKDGFNDFYFKNEIKIRVNPIHDFILPILAKGDRWYREKLLFGRCLVRSSGDQYKLYLESVINSLKTIYANSIEEIDVYDYCCMLANCYRPMIIKIVKEKHIICQGKLEHVIQYCLDTVVKIKEKIPVVLSHGDLQTGNIYIDEENDKVYIIDWETVKKRSVWYDAATVMCSTRRKDKFSAMINHISDDLVRSEILIFDENKVRNMKLVSAVLLMEELGFFLEEIVDLPDNMGSEIIERFVYEIDRIECLKEA